MASPRRNPCDDIVRLIDEALADQQRWSSVAAADYQRRTALVALRVPVPRPPALPAGRRPGELGRP